MNKILILIFLIPQLSFAAIGNDQGNGGLAVACSNSVELFDLYEGRALLGLNPVEKDGDYKIIAREKIEVFANLFYDKDFQKTMLTSRLNRILNNLVMLPSGVGLELTEDVANFIKPKKCQIVQLANYRNDDKVFIDSDLWNALTPTQKAATLVHETIYLHLRENSILPIQRPGVISKESNSTRVRKAVAYLFSEKQLEEVYGGIKTNGLKIACMDDGQPITLTQGNTSFILYRETNGHMKARFGQISGRESFTKNEITFEDGEGIQGMALHSLIDNGLSFIFYEFPNLEKLGNISSNSMKVKIINKLEKTEYNSTFSCTKEEF